MLDTPLLVHGRFKNGGLIKQNDSSRLVTRQSYNGAAFFYLSFLLDKTATNMPKAIISDNAWKTLIGCETSLKIFPYFHGPHLTGKRQPPPIKLP